MGNEAAPSPASSAPRRLLARWTGMPVYLRILVGMALGLLAALLLGPAAEKLIVPARLVLRLLSAIAPPFILFAILRAFMHTELPRGTLPRLGGLLLLNTLVAIGIGIAVANLLRPGEWMSDTPLAPPAGHSGPKAAWEQFLDNVPKSLLGPLTDDGKVISVILVAIAFGVALRSLRYHPVRTLADVVEIGFSSLLKILHWIIELVPLAVFCVVASIVGTRGLGAFVPLGGFVVAVLVALALQTGWYLTRVRFGSWVRPLELLRGMRDALVMAFSTASSAATMPLTYACLRERVGISERSASLGALVGANFNNDGTALYEAMAALFVAQLLGLELTFAQQLLVVVTSVAASVGAAGIPEAGLVTMTLVFHAVGLPVEYIAMLLTVDWFLDRCRTTINVLGDVNVSALLDGRRRPEPDTGEKRGQVGDTARSEI
jgi:Na+/H+-dicarboxylate symporter